MGNGRFFYTCRCGGEIMEEYDASTESVECNTCNNPQPLPDLYIVGEAGSGKDYIADLIKEIYPSYKSIAIADPLYELVGCLKEGNTQGFVSILLDLGLNDYQSVSALKRVTKEMMKEIMNPSTLKPRKSLQTLGDIIRSYYENALIQGVSSRTTGPTIVSDVRLTPEGKYLKECGFIGIKVSADEHKRAERLEIRDVVVDNSTRNHITETQINNIPFDYLIDNTIGDRDTLIGGLYEIIKK